MNPLFKQLIVVVTFFMTSFCLYAESNERVSMVFGGDVMFSWGIRREADNLGDLFFEDLSEIFQGADYSGVNLETAISENAKVDPHKSYVFNGVPSDLQYLKKIGVKMLFLANNHTMDFGKIGLQETTENIKRYELEYTGAGNTIKEAQSPHILKIQGNQFAFYSATMVGEKRLYAGVNQPGVAPMQIQPLKKLDNQTIKLLSLHWGEEYRPTPLSWQKKLGRKLIDAGIKVVIGHHSHIPQGIEKYKDGLILYSLGNFIFGSRNSYLTHNILVRIYFKKNRIDYCEVIPIFGKFQETNHKMEILTGSEAEKFLVYFQKLCKELNTVLKIDQGRGFIFFQ